MQVLVIPSTKKHVNDPVYVLREWDTCQGVSLTLNLTAPATLRISVSSRQNDRVALIKDFGYVAYPAGNSTLAVGDVVGMIGINLQFLDTQTFVSVSEGFKSSYELNNSYATVYLNYSAVPSYTPSITGQTLSTILSGSVPPAGTRAVPSDVVGCTLESDGTQWGGFLGNLTAAQFTAIQAYNSVIAPRSRVLVPNAAVDAGFSYLERGVTIAWKPPSGEVIAEERGTPLWTQNGGFSAGVLNQLYRGTIIPDYMIPDGLSMIYSVSLRLSDTTSTANWYALTGISGADYAGTDPNDSQVGRLSGTAQTYWLGVTPFERRIWRQGSAIRGSSGATIANSDTYRSIGSFVSGAMRFRSAVFPGATSNFVEIDRYSLRSAG